MKSSVFYSFLILAVLSIGFTSCATAKKVAKKQAVHEDMFARILSNTNITPAARLDSMATSFVGMMSEGLRIANPKKGAEYVKGYTNRNSLSIGKVIEQYSQYHQGLSKGERVASVLSLATKPYTRDLIDLVPRFIAKYKTIKTVTSLTKKVKRNFLDIGLKELGL